MNDCSYVYNNTLPSKMQYETEKTKKRKRDRGKKSRLPCGCCNNKEGMLCLGIGRHQLSGNLPEKTTPLTG